MLNPAAPWQYAIDPDVTKMTLKHLRDESAPLPGQVWTSAGPPTAIEVDGYEINWPLANGTAADPPQSPVAVEKRDKKRIRLIPYGAAKLHIAEFPVAGVAS